MQHLTTEDVRRNHRLFALDGAFFTLASMLGGNTNNLFLSKMGATDYQLSMVALTAQIFSISMLIPLSLLTDRRKNKRSMLVILLIFVGSFYVANSILSTLSLGSVLPLVICIGLAVGGVSLCTSTWQAYFSDVTPPGERNHTYSVRNQACFLIQICGPLSVAFILSRQPDIASQLVVHRVCYLIIGLAVALDIIMLFRIKGGERDIIDSFSLGELRAAVRDLAHNKAFLIFAFSGFFFYFAWQLDGTMFYVSLTQYLELNDFWYIFSNVCCGIAQIITIRLWEKKNLSLGIEKVLAIGTMGLVISPLCIIIPMNFTGGVRLITHLLLRGVADSMLGAVNLNMLQNLLSTIGEKNRAFSISVYTTITAIAMALGPVSGVAIYSFFGKNPVGLVEMLLVMMFLRSIATGNYFLRCRKKKA